MPRPSPDGDLIGSVYSPSPNNDQFWMIGGAARRAADPVELQRRAGARFDVAPGQQRHGRRRAGYAGDRGEFGLWRIPLVGNADSDAAQIPVDAALNYLDDPRFDWAWRSAARWAGTVEHE